MIEKSWEDDSDKSGPKTAYFILFFSVCISHTLLRRIKRSNMFDYRPNIKDIE
jgi:hypothetical protein